MLDPKHVRTLKRIQEGKVIRKSKHNPDLDYLLDLGYIEITVCDKPGDYFAQPYLTEKGLAKLYDVRRRFIEVWLPVALSCLLSIAAIVISIISLLK